MHEFDSFPFNPASPTLYGVPFVSKLVKKRILNFTMWDILYWWGYIIILDWWGYIIYWWGYINTGGDIYILNTGGDIYILVGI